MSSKVEMVRVGAREVPPGTLARFEIPVARLFTDTWVNLPVVVINGSRPGPRIWLDAALHGDELNGMEAIRRALVSVTPEELKGAILAVPVVNVFGLIHQSRYLPDRRDLNRSFPGSVRGSMASRLAHLFLKEIVDQCAFGLDLHTGSLHRTNLPQVRGDLTDPRTREMAEAFGAPLMMHSKTIQGSLRAAANKRKIPMLVYEAGEPLRFNRRSISIGKRGILRVLTHLGMLEREAEELPDPFEAKSSRWVRASRSGVFRIGVKLGDVVTRGQALGTISNPLALKESQVKAPARGMVISFTNNPLVHQGDALVHLAFR